MPIVSGGLRQSRSKQDVWSVAEAKANLSQVVEQALSRGPQALTRNGRMTAVVVSVEEWERKTKRTGSLADFLAASPLRGVLNWS